MVDAPQVRVVVVTGQHDVGKSRLVLEATSHRPQDVVFALDPRSMKLDDFRNLVAGQHEVLCVVEDPEPDEPERLINEVLGIEGLKVIITLPTSDPVASLSYGTDERIQSIPLESLSDEDTRKLLTATGKRLDFGVESWILDRAGGNPGILLAATSIGEKLRDERDNFETAVGREFAKRIDSVLGNDALKCAELFSLLTHVGVSGQFEGELKLVCEILGGNGWGRPRVLSLLGGLEKAGLAKRGGSFVEITIPFLANYLVAELLRGRKNEVFALFAWLDEGGRLRFLRRLSQVRSQEVRLFWDALFDPNYPGAPFGNFDSALRQDEVLRLVAGTVPERTVLLLEAGLIGTSHEERLAISDEPRRELMWALQQLLFRANTSRRALRLIWLLAEAENENWGNNATGVLSECFHPMHRQMPLLLSERIDALKEFTSEVASKKGVLVAIRAASKALEPSTYSLRHSTGTEPLDKWPVFTRLDAYEYARALVDLFFEVAGTKETEVAREALEKLPRLVLDLGIQGQPKEALERFAKLVDWAKSEELGLEVFWIFENIEFLRESLERYLQESGLSDDRKTEFQRYLVDADRLKTTIESGSFALRLKLRASGRSREDHERFMVGGIEATRGYSEINALAKEAIAEPTLLTPGLISWLLSARALNAHDFFFQLGKEDSQRRLRLKIEDLGSQVTGARVFSAYWGGWSSINRVQAENRLINLANSNSVTGEAIILATGYLGPSEAILRLIGEKILKGNLTAEMVSGILYGDWIRGLSGEQFLKLVEVVAGPQLENAVIAINIVGRWIHENRPLKYELAELAWQCLKAVPAISHNEAYRFDELASKLAQVEPERGFGLLEKLLRVPHDRHAWNPIDRFGALKNHFWAVLHSVDPERAIRTVFSVALTELERRFWVTSDFQNILDQENDAGVLIKLATENERVAEVIAESITAARPGFWPLAFRIIEKYPSNMNIQSALTVGIEQAEGGWGPYSSHLASSRQEVERVLKDPATPSTARPWLRDIQNRLEGSIAQHVIWEYDEDVNDLRRYIDLEEKNSHERLWAIARVLKYADWKDIRRMLTVEDIEEALPQVDLPESKRKTIERALEVWRGGG